MKKIYISTITAALLSTNILGADSIKGAFENGKVSGDITLYGENVNVSSGTDSGYTMGSIGIEYETDTYKGYKAEVAFRTNHDFSEKENGDYANGTEPKAALSKANISYTNENSYFIKAGRQEIDLEWIGDYHEAVVAGLTYIPNTTIVLGHTERFMAVDNDGALSRMADIGTNGAQVLDVKYTGIDNLTINPYYMNADKIFDAYGLKVTADIEGFGLTAHYAATNEDVAGTADGDIVHFEVNKDIENISLVAGYIQTDKNGGIGSISTLGDNIDPMEDLGNTYTADSTSYYASISTELSGFNLGAAYGTNSYGTVDDSEIVLTAGTTVNDISVELLYSTTDLETANDTDKVTLTLSYAF